MTASTSRAAYTDCFELFNKALEKGRIRVGFDDHGSAHQIYNRLQYARVLDREENRQIYEAGDPNWGISAYDALIVRYPREQDEKWWVYIEPRSALRYDIEELAAE